MPRVKRGVVRRQKRKKLSKLTKGYFQNKSKLYKFMREAAEKAGVYAYVGRKRKKRDYRSRPHLQRVHEGPQDGRHRARPQEPRRARRARAGCLRGARGKGQGRAAGGVGRGFRLEASGSRKNACPTEIDRSIAARQQALPEA